MKHFDDLTLFYLIFDDLMPYTSGSYVYMSLMCKWKLRELGMEILKYLLDY